MGRGYASESAATPGRQRRPESYRGWSEERIRAELDRFIAERPENQDGSFFPTKPQLKAAGAGALAKAIYRQGGVVYWAQRLGIPLAPGQDRRAYGLDRALADARAIVASQGALPNTKTIRDLGYPRLSSFLMAYPGSARAFRAAYGFQPQRPGGRSPRSRTL